MDYLWGQEIRSVINITLTQANRQWHGRCFEESSESQGRGRVPFLQVSGRRFYVIRLFLIPVWVAEEREREVLVCQEGRCDSVGGK